jgi:hypothetical protein
MHIPLSRGPKWGRKIEGCKDKMVAENIGKKLQKFLPPLSGRKPVPRTISLLPKIRHRLYKYFCNFPVFFNLLFKV